MQALLSALRRIPYWAFLLIFIIILVNSVYLYYKGKLPDDGLTYKLTNGHWIADTFKSGSSAYMAGIRSGDIIFSIDNYPVEEWMNSNLGLKAGDTVIYQIERNNHLVKVPAVIGSYFPNAAGFFWLFFVVQTLFSIAILYILAKKPHEKAIQLFFVYLQLFAVNTNAWSLSFPDLPAIIACNVFLFSGCLIGIVLIHFHLVFPKPVKLLTRFKWFPMVIYITGTIVYFLIRSSNTIG